jgi:hypothetical protein
MWRRPCQGAVILAIGADWSCEAPRRDFPSTATAARGGARAGQGWRLCVELDDVRGVGTSDEPAAYGRIQRVAIDTLEHPAHGRLTRRPIGPVRIVQRGPTAQQQPAGMRVASPE